MKCNLCEFEVPGRDRVAVALMAQHLLEEHGHDIPVEQLQRLAEEREP